MQFIKLSLTWTSRWEFSHWEIAVVSCESIIAVQCVPHRAGGETLAVLPTCCLWTLLVLCPTYYILSGRFAPLLRTAGHFPVLCLASFAVLIGKYLFSLVLMLLCLVQSQSLCFLLLISIRLCEIWAMRYTFTENLTCLLIYKECGHNDTFISLQYMLVLCNSIGTPLDPKYIDIGKQPGRVLFCCWCFPFLVFIMNFLYKSVVQWNNHNVVTPLASECCDLQFYMWL